MKTKIMVILSVCILAVFNYGIYEKEQIKANGQILLLELAPVDPRSLMQGDYMVLRFAIERVAAKSVKDIPGSQKRGYMVIKADANNVAQFVRFFKGSDLLTEEKLLYFRRQYTSVNIIPNSFFFQEGHAKHYEAAKYGVFKFDDKGNHLLVALADKDRKVIEVPKS